LEELADYGFFDVGESRKSLWESDQAIVIRIHTTQNDNLQKAFASLVFSLLAASRIPSKVRFRDGSVRRLQRASRPTASGQVQAADNKELAHRKGA
jgi:hypothetical protein